MFGVLLWGLAAAGYGAEAVYSASGSLPMLEPAVERRAINVPNIDTEHFEVGVYVGVLSVEDFGSNMLTGAHVAVHATEDFFLEGSIGSATVTDESFRTTGFGPFGNGTTVLNFYNLVLGYNLFPGQIFLGRSRTWTSAAYVVAGVGNSHISDDDYFTYVLGMGLRVLPTDWLSLRVEARGHEMETNLLGRQKMSHNFEANFSIGVFF